MRATDNFFDDLMVEIYAGTLQTDNTKIEQTRAKKADYTAEERTNAILELQAVREEHKRLSAEYKTLYNRVEELKVTKELIENATRKVKNDGKALLAALLEAYKGLDDAAMTKFEWGLSKQSNTAGHRFQEELDLFIKVHEAKKAGKNASIIYNYGTIVVDSYLDSSHFQNNNKPLQS